MLFQVQPMDFKLINDDNSEVLYALLPCCSKLKGVYAIMSQTANMKKTHDWKLSLLQSKQTGSLKLEQQTGLR